MRKTKLKNPNQRVMRPLPFHSLGVPTKVSCPEGQNLQFLLGKRDEIFPLEDYQYEHLTNVARPMVMQRLRSDSSWVNLIHHMIKTR